MHTSGVSVLAILLALGCASGTASDEEDDDNYSSASVGGNGTSSVAGPASGVVGAGGSSGVTTTSTVAATTSSGAGGSPSGCDGGTGFSSAMDMFNWVNMTRQQYAIHDPYDGMPWQGAYTTTMTWSLLMQWDATLAQEAQGEADALAGGSPPTGQTVGYANCFGATPEVMWMTGLSSPKFQVSAKSDGNLTGPPSSPNDPCKWHEVSNGSYRMGIAYQTGTGSFNQKTKLGVGCADAGNNVTWWVLIFGN